MAATARQFNWSSVGYTPSGGSLTTFSGVTDCNIDPGGTLAMFSGDNDRYPTTIVVPVSNPAASVTLANYAASIAIPIGTNGTFIATHRDALSAVNGAISFTLINAIVENNPGGGSWGQFGSGTFSVKAYSSDGSTNPLSFTRT